MSGTLGSEQLYSSTRSTECSVPANGARMFREDLPAIERVLVRTPAVRARAMFGGVIMRDGRFDGSAHWWDITPSTHRADRIQ